MKKIESQALDVLKRAIGLSGPDSPVTELTDGVVDQALEVGPIIRRSRTQARTEGIYTGLMRNIHVAADSRTSALNPFNPAAQAIAPYPAPMPVGFDVWVLNAAVTQLSGSGTISAALNIECPARIMGISSIGAPVVSVQNIAFWDTIVVESTTFALKAPAAQPSERIGVRLPRDPGTRLFFASTSSAAATFDCFVTLGVFPIALGQDVLV